MHRSENDLTRVLIVYLVPLQLVHLAFLARAGWIWWTSGRIPFPALPPPGGWAPQVVPFLLSLGIVDAFVALLTLIFVVAHIRNHPRSRTLGLVSLSAMTYSALVYAGGTILTGAWAAHPAAYFAVAAAFTPVFVLGALLTADS